MARLRCGCVVGGSTIRWCETHSSKDKSAYVRARMIDEWTIIGGQHAATVAIRELDGIKCGGMALCVGPVERAIAALLWIANPGHNPEWSATDGIESE